MYGSMTQVAEGLGCDPRFGVFESRMLPQEEAMRVLGRKRGKLCVLCKKRNRAKNALVCLYCFNHVKMPKVTRGGS